MSNIENSEIPGIGKKFSLKIDDGIITVIITYSGERYITYNSRSGEKDTTIKLTSEQTRELAAILISGDLIYL